MFAKGFWAKLKLVFHLGDVIIVESLISNHAFLIANRGFVVDNKGVYEGFFINNNCDLCCCSILANLCLTVLPYLAPKRFIDESSFGNGILFL